MFITFIIYSLKLMIVYSLKLLFNKANILLNTALIIIHELNIVALIIIIKY